MTSVELGCPKCHERFALNGETLAVPPGRVAYVKCPSCGHKGGAGRFEREWTRLRKVEERAVAEAERDAAQETRRVEEEARLAEEEAREAAREREREAARQAAGEVAEARAKERRLRMMAVGRKREEEVSKARNAVLVLEEPHEFSSEDGLWAVVAVAATVLCWWAGVYLLRLEAQSRESMLEAIAHGIGLYFLAKGCFLGPAVWLMAKAVRRRRFGRDWQLERLGRLEDRGGG